MGTLWVGRGTNTFFAPILVENIRKIMLAAVFIDKIPTFVLILIAFNLLIFLKVLRRF